MAKIVHLTSVHEPSDTRIYRKECRTLADAGHEVILVAPAPSDEKKEGVRIVGIGRPRNRWIRVWNTARRTVQRARSMDADVYHLHDPELLPWSWVLLKGRAPIIYDMHEDLVAQLRTKDWLPSSFRPLFSRVAEVGLRVLLRGHPVIFAERSYRERYDWLSRTATVQNMPVVSELIGIDEPKFSTPALGYIGGVRPDRGSNVTLRAIAILQREGYDVGWECVGPVAPSHKKSLEALQGRLGVRNVRMPGYLPPEQGWRRMARCHVGIAMLKKTPNFVGSYPTKLFEYMALGLPVITSDIPMYRRIVEQAECGFVADPTNPQAIAEAVASLLDDLDRAQRMGERGREAVRESYNWEQEGQKLLGFYNTIVASRG